MDKGPAGRHHTLTGVQGRHNYLLGGYGDDTIYGGDTGDVIWGDYHPGGESRQTAVIHAGTAGTHLLERHGQLRLDGHDPATVVHAHEPGVIHCESPGIWCSPPHALPPQARRLPALTSTPSALTQPRGPAPPARRG